MKRIILTTAVVLFSVVITLAYSKKFDKEMKSKIETLRNYNEATDYIKLGDEFAEVAKENKKKFEPLYYSAYSYIIGSWNTDDADEKMNILGKAKEQIDKALKLETNNDEVLVLEGFYNQAMIMVNPMQNGPSFSMRAEELLKKAQAINSANPRAEFLLAQNIYYRPEQFGGGEIKACPKFQKAAKLFEKQDTDNYLLPQWGEKTNSEMLKKCEK